MTTPPWGHKPRPVADTYQYCGGLTPPWPSPRMTYWITRLRAGTWRPNRYVLDGGWDSRAGALGIWGWESINVLTPIASWPKGYRDQRTMACMIHRGAPEAVTYWEQLEEVTRPDGRRVADVVWDICGTVRLSNKRTRPVDPAAERVRDHTAAWRSGTAVSSTRHTTVEAMATRLGTDLRVADGIVTQLLAETIAEAEARTWKMAAWGLRSDGALFPVGNPCRATLERAAWAIEQREQQ